MCNDDACHPRSVCVSYVNDGGNCTLRSYCNPFLAVRGERCDEQTSITWFLVASSAAVSCLFLSGLLSTLSLIRRRRRIAKEKQRKHFNAADTTTFLVSISFVSHAVWSVAYVLCGTLVDATFYSYSHVRPVAVTVAGPSLIMGLLNVSMMWLEVAEASTRMRSRTRSIQLKVNQGGRARTMHNLQRSKKAVLLAGALFAFACFAFIPLGHVEFASYLSILYALVIELTFRRGSRAISRVILSGLPASAATSSSSSSAVTVATAYGQGKTAEEEQQPPVRKWRARTMERWAGQRPMSRASVTLMLG
jgi:hypothetical protein